jgi:hypothetical protein
MNSHKSWTTRAILTHNTSKLFPKKEDDSFKPRFQKQNLDFHTLSCTFLHFLALSWPKFVDRDSCLECGKLECWNSDSQTQIRRLKFSKIGSRAQIRIVNESSRTEVLGLGYSNSGSQTRALKLGFSNTNSHVLRQPSVHLQGYSFIQFTISLETFILRNLFLGNYFFGNLLGYLLLETETETKTETETET